MKRSSELEPDDCGVLVAGEGSWTGGFLFCGEPLPCTDHPEHCRTCGFDFRSHGLPECTVCRGAKRLLGMRGEERES